MDNMVMDQKESEKLEALFDKLVEQEVAEEHFQLVNDSSMDSILRPNSHAAGAGSDGDVSSVDTGADSSCSVGTEITAVNATCRPRVESDDTTEVNSVDISNKNGKWQWPCHSSVEVIYRATEFP